MFWATLLDFVGLLLALLQEVPAGNVLAIAGLDTAILKSATLASSPASRPLAPMLFQARMYYMYHVYYV
jgi:ribosome assembly protein 1